MGKWGSNGRWGQRGGAKEDKLIQKWRIYLFITEAYYRNYPPLHLIKKDLSSAIIRVTLISLVDFTRFLRKSQWNWNVKTSNDKRQAKAFISPFSLCAPSVDVNLSLDVILSAPANHQLSNLELELTEMVLIHFWGVLFVFLLFIGRNYRL